MFDEKSGFEFATDVIENGPNPIAEISSPFDANEPTATLPKAIDDGVSVIPSGISGPGKIHLYRYGCCVIVLTHEHRCNCVSCHNGCISCDGSSVLPHSRVTAWN